jgi:hypothetical protein
LREPPGIGNNRIVLNRGKVPGDIRPVPTLFRFIAFLAIVGGLIFAGMIALVTFVQPEQREMVEIVPPSKLQQR